MDDAGHFPEEIPGNPHWENPATIPGAPGISPPGKIPRQSQEHLNPRTFPGNPRQNLGSSLPQKNQGGTPRENLGNRRRGNLLETYENTGFLLLRRPPGGLKPMKTQGCCSPGPRWEAENNPPDPAGRSKTYENAKLLLPRTPPGGPKQTYENASCWLPRTPPGGPTIMKTQGFCSPGPRREAYSL